YQPMPEDMAKHSFKDSGKKTATTAPPKREPIATPVGINNILKPSFFICINTCLFKPISIPTENNSSNNNIEDSSSVTAISTAPPANMPTPMPQRSVTNI